jgi:predicted secreted protein
MPLDETGVRDASYGPAGLVTTGAAFEKRDVPGLAESYRKLNADMRRLRREDFQLWASLIEPYLSDTADPSAVDDWRQKIAALDAENAAIRAENERRKKKGRPAKPEKVRHVYMREQLLRHDHAVKRLAEYRKGERLHVVYPKLMSTREREAGEAHNAQVNATVERLRVSGLREEDAAEQTAEMFGISRDEVARIREFRSDIKLATCAEVGCGGNVYQQNLCQKHYQREWRTRRKNAS